VFYIVSSRFVRFLIIIISLVSFISESLDIHRRLKGGVEFLEKLPKTDTGKVLRRLVKENVLAKLKNSN